jgi:hypothetical protein
MPKVFVLRTGASFLYRFDFSAQVPATVTVSGVSFTGVGLTLDNQSNDLSNNRATIRVSGAEHSRNYQLRGMATLSNGETVPDEATIRGWDD